jgi:uncharacterized protein with PIN domain
MTKLFIELYLDEDVDVLLADLLRPRGYDVVTVRDAGRLGLSDDEQLAFATKEGRAVLTHNRLDFEALAADFAAQGREHAGIIIATRRPVYDLLRRLLVILDALTADEIRNTVQYI